MDKTILIISNVTNGLYMFRRELLERLVKMYNVEILAGDTGRVDVLETMGCHVTITEIERHGTNPIKELQLIRYYKKKIKEIKPKVVLTYTVKPNIYGGMACACLGVPYVANITGLGTAIEQPGKLQKPLLFLLKRGFRKAQKVFFQNSENMNFLLKHRVISGAYELIPGSGVNLERFPLLDYPQSDTLDFVFISRIMKEKGIDQYIDAAKVIRQKYPNTRFHICGDAGTAYKELLEQMQKDGIVIYHGKISDVPKMHKVSACTIHPTYYPEGMSNVLLESCACGRPIITTDRPGCREIVDDGINGFIVKQQDSQDLIEKIEKFISLSWDERKQMGLAGRAKVEHEFDRRIVVNKYLEEIKRAGL
ncbi:glycosyltransferase family 4 protein [Ruminococcus albus]|uniref:Glycosyltransferase, group 1 family protein n=1 Tax=Ruminococcus albus 8 TaxID=246199 RepID=E9S8J3_RUMAL|nr:glycosyltransferase family 4 protein [Ruminococcus albus]EGC04381.1 glycosyltransferase, group 1 family protein [Ruminococcus albus 8]MCC3351463.1 glycosyltransferase family 4 protein [Ruminococcus albus 8]